MNIQYHKYAAPPFIDWYPRIHVIWIGSYRIFYGWRER